MIVGFWDGFLVPFWDIWGAMGHPMAPIFAPRSWASWLARVTWRPVGIHPSALWRLIFLALYSWFCFCFIFLHLHSWFDIPGCRFLVLFFRFYIPGFIFRFIFLADLVYNCRIRIIIIIIIIIIVIIIIMITSSLLLL